MCPQRCSGKTLMFETLEVSNDDVSFSGLLSFWSLFISWALLFMPLVILHHLLNVFVQLANKNGFTKKKKIGILEETEIMSF
jgi:hypothetical protein